MHGKYYDNKKIMPLDLYKKIINETSAYENPNERTKAVIYSSSGEPLVNPEINSFIEYTNKKGIDQALITNGTALSRKNIMETILDNVFWARVSLNAGTPETRSYIHGTAASDYSNVLNSLSKLGNLKQQKNSSCQLGAQIVVSEDNVDEIILATKNARETGIDYFQIKPVIFHPKDGRPQLNVDFWDRVVNDSKEAKDMYGTDNFEIFIKMDQFDAIRQKDLDMGAYSHCLNAFSPIIEADGSVYHCSQTRGIGSNKMGDLSKQSFREIWESNLRKIMFMGINKDECQPICRCHPNNKVLTELIERGITSTQIKNLDAIKKQGGCGSNFI